MSNKSQVYDAASFEEFVQLCNKHGLLEQPRNLGLGDVANGFNDKTTLL
jgi:hypothetical protein